MPPPSPPTRRGFLAKLLALTCGIFVCAVPAAIGLVASLSPLRWKSRAGRFVRLTSLAALPADGTPRRFPVVADRTDAWNRFPNEPIGAVFLCRTAEDTVEAFQVVCPHAGCSITYETASDGGAGKFFCPCHAASFGLDGSRLDKTSASPRDMDTLEVRIENETDVLVKFEDFETGTSRKVAKA